MSRGRFMFGVGIGGLFSDFELFGNSDRKVRERKAMELIGMIERIWAQDPPYDLEGEFWSVKLKDAIIPELGIGYMPKPYRKSGPPISMSVASRNSPTARVAALARLGHHLGQQCAERMRSARIGRSTARPAPRPASRRAATTGAWRAMSWWRRATPRRATACSCDNGSNRYFYSYMREVLSRVGLLSALKPRADMTDEEATVDAITEGSAIYGSPKTLLDKLVAFRDAAGPFGTLLMTGLDWSGPNAAWEREFDAAFGARRDAEIPPARDGAGGLTRAN